MLSNIFRWGSFMKLGPDNVRHRRKFKLMQPSLFLHFHSEWTETFPYDFRDERMMRHLRDITQKCVAVDQSLRKNVGQIMQALIRKVSSLLVKQGVS